MRSKPIVIAFYWMGLSGFAPLNASALQKQAGPNERLDHAVVALKDAKRALEQVLQDFGGYRVNAVTEVDQALKELEKARSYARHHPDEIKKSPDNS